MTDDKAQASSTMSLPPDGTIIRVSDWRRRILWIGTGVFSFIGISVIVSAIQVGRLMAAIPALISAGVIYASIRMPLSGVILEQRGVKARSLWRTYHWQWDEIEKFELRNRGETPRFRVHLTDGSSKGFLGFFARSPEQEKKGQLLFEALEERLEREHAKRLP